MNRPSCLTTIMIIIAAFAFTAATADVVLDDDFETTNVGSFPWASGWQLVYDGSGGALQYVDDAHSLSGAKSLRLVGSYCWSAVAYHPVAGMQSRVIVRAHFYVDQIVPCGCGADMALMGLYNPSVGSWGTAYGYVVFACDGNMYAGDRPLMPYVAQRWYALELEVDLEARVFNAYVDGTLLATGVPIPTSGGPTGMYVYAGHGGSPTVWVDDVSVETECASIGPVGNLRLEKTQDGASVHLTWDNASNAEDYVVYQDDSAMGAFGVPSGTATNGTAGLTTPDSAETTYYLVAGRNAACGVGPRRK